MLVLLLGAAFAVTFGFCSYLAAAAASTSVGVLQVWFITLSLVFAIGAFAFLKAASELYRESKK